VTSFSLGMLLTSFILLISNKMTTIKRNEMLEKTFENFFNTIHSIIEKELGENE
jgi:5-enolpyruvylshikimate-3-phosphate synthase